MDTEFLSRLQFAFTISFHYIYPPLSIGLGLIIVIMEGAYLKTGNKVYEKMTRFWIRIFALIFGLGVATGIIMEFEFGTNWANYSWFVGDIFGAPAVPCVPPAITSWAYAFVSVDVASGDGWLSVQKRHRLPVVRMAVIHSRAAHSAFNFSRRQFDYKNLCHIFHPFTQTDRRAARRRSGGKNALYCLPAFRL